MTDLFETQWEKVRDQQHKRNVMQQVLENTRKALKKEEFPVVYSSNNPIKELIDENDPWIKILNQIRTKFMFSSYFPRTDAADRLAETSKIILPVIRRIAAMIMANDIIGVQPMTGPVAQIFTMRARYGEDYHLKILTLLKQRYKL